MPAGNYELRYAFGSSWYGDNRFFGADTIYAKDKDYYDFSQNSWEIMLYTSSKDGQKMDVKSIDPNDF